jgi:hypothetical protein
MAAFHPLGFSGRSSFPTIRSGVSRQEKHARLHLRDLCLIETFTFFGPSDTPAVLNMTIEWDAPEEPVKLGSGNAVPPDDPAAFLGNFARAKSTAQFSGRQLGFSFRSDPGVSTQGGYAEIGTERNGVFL